MSTIKKKKNIYITHILRGILIYYIKGVGESRNIYTYIVTLQQEIILENSCL